MSSPFEVQVGAEAGPQKIRAWGPGLEGGVVGKSADFVAESIGTDVGVLGEFLVLTAPTETLSGVKILIPGEDWVVSSSGISMA